MTPQTETYKTNLEFAPDYRSDLDAILDRSLTPESIDTYADEALEDLVELVQRTTSAYGHQPTVHFGTERGTETAAFDYYHLGDVETMLDHIADTADGLKAIDVVIAQATVSERVITPPDSIDVAIGSGNGTLEKKHTIPRLKTLLFILASDFEVDLHDPKQVNLTRGELNPTMMRQESYYSVQVPKIDRTILVCDEEDNATFVFDDVILKQFGIDNDDLLGLTKSDLNELLSDNALLGKRIIYSKDFVVQMVAALEDLSSNPNASDGEAKYLCPKVPEGYLSKSGMRVLWQVNNEAVQTVIEELGESLGAILIYKFGSHQVSGFSPAQQVMIRQQLEVRGLLIEQVPEGYLAIYNMADLWKRSSSTIRKAIDELGDGLGEVPIYRFVKRKALGYSPAQQVMIRQQLEERDSFNERAPEGYLSITGMADLLKVDYSSTLQKAIDELSDNLGEVKRYRFRTHSAPGYSPAQQVMISQHLEAKGSFSERAPDGYLSMAGIADLLKAQSPNIQNAIDELSDNLGEVKLYKFRTQLALGYSPSQQNLIYRHLESKGFLGEPIPEGYVSRNGMAYLWKVGGPVVKKAIKELGDSLGEVRLYGFNPAHKYSPFQQAMIQQHLEAKGSFSERAPDGYLSMAGIADLLKENYGAVRKAVDELDISLGEIQLYRFGTRTHLGYSPEQQVIIKQYIDVNRHFSN